MERMTIERYTELSGTDISDIQVCIDKEPVAVYVGDDGDCPFTGVEYSDGTYSICGLGTDDIVTKEEMERALDASLDTSFDEDREDDE